MNIIGIYKIPKIKHAFFIVSSLDGVLDNQQLSIENKSRIEYFAHILQSKDHICPKEVQQWTLKIVSKNDFARVIEQHIPTQLELTNQSSQDPEFSELLAINLNLDSSMVLSKVPIEDIIEVFID